MKFLVIGASGQLALSLAEMSLAEGDRLSLAGRPDIDLLVPETVEAGIAGAAPDLVVNAAAYTAVDKAESEPDLAFAVNADGAGHVAAACERTRIPLIHISTDYVFDGRKFAPYVETDDAAPINVYGKSKREGERLVLAACENALVLRSAWIHSPFGNNFVRTMLRLAAENDEISVVADQTGCPTYAPHFAQTILSIARIVLADTTDAAPKGTYHAAGSGGASWFEFAEEIFRRSGNLAGPTAELNPIQAEMYPTAAARPANSQLDGAKLAQHFGITLPDWRLGVADCVARICAE